MKPQLLKVFKDQVHSFNARRGTRPDINNHWHYHPEIELVYFKSGHGTQFIGDKISTFSPGDIVLVGKNLPHYWQFDKVYFENSSEALVDVYVIHFNDDFWGNQFLTLPENKELREVLKRSSRGLYLPGKDNTDLALAPIFEKMLDATGTRTIILLLELLLSLSSSDKTELLASLGFQHSFEEAEKDRINAIYNYSISNFNKKISLDEIAAIANMSPNSFCKYFKNKSHKTYTQFINEIRVGYACKLLIESPMDVKEICYRSGFNNFASFHKFFKLITGKSPLGYQKSHLG